MVFVRYAPSVAGQFDFASDGVDGTPRRATHKLVHFIMAA
jgi:hypothetical protein